MAEHDDNFSTLAEGGAQVSDNSLNEAERLELEAFRAKAAQSANVDDDADLEDDPEIEDEWIDEGEPFKRMINPGGREVDVPYDMVGELIGKGFIYAKGETALAGVAIPLGQQDLAQKQIESVSDGEDVDIIDTADSPEVAATKRKVAETKKKRRRG